MPNRRTTIDEHDPLAFSILQVLEEFIDEIGRRGCTGHFNKVVSDRFELHGRHLVQEPERFTEDHLVFPMLEDVFGYSIQPRPKQYAPPWPKRTGIPDFCVTSIPITTAMDHELRLFGEVKRPKHIEDAEKEIKEYLRMEEGFHAIGVISDGFDWQLWVRPKGESLDDLVNPYAEASLKAPLRTVRTRNMTNEPYSPHDVRNNIDTDNFNDFTIDAIMDVIEAEFGIDKSLL